MFEAVLNKFYQHNLDEEMYDGIYDLVFDLAEEESGFSPYHHICHEAEKIGGGNPPEEDWKNKPMIKLEKLLEEIDCDRASSDVLLGFAMATNVMKDNLKTRPAFMERVREAYSSHPEFEEIFQGLW